MPGFATPFFEDLCLASFWTFSARGKQDLNPSKLKLASEDITTIAIVVQYVLYMSLELIMYGRYFSLKS